MHSRVTPLASALRAIIVGLTVATASHAAMAANSQPATEQAPRQSYDIAAGSLDRVLGAFGNQAGVMIAIDSALAKGVQSQGLHGSFAVAEGLERLLAPLGMQAEYEQGSYRVVARAADGQVQLQATQISANQLGSITEGTGSYTPGTIATATRMVLTPRETPQSISVVTRQVMDDFGLNAIDDVMRHTPGITVSTYDTERTNYYSRGFSIVNFQYDGIPTLRDAQYSAGQTLTDMALYDRVEVLKGATGLLTGAGGPGGTINLIRKKPTSEFKSSIELGAGSWDNYRSQIDVSGPLTETGNVRGRAVAAYQDKKSFLDHYSRKTGVYYGILEVDLDPDTLLTLGADYQDSDPKGSSWTGTRTIFDPAGNKLDLPRSFNNGPKWSSWEQYSRTLFATLEHNFDNGWVTKGQYNHQINGYDAPLGYISQDTLSASSIFARKYTGETTSDSLDVYASGPFELFGREHQLVVGQSLSISKWKGKDYGSATYFDNSYDFYQWHGEAIKPLWNQPTKINDETTRQTGSYITGRFSLMDDLHLLLGTRIANYQVTGTSDTQESGKVVPYAGLTYDLNDNFTAYASYTEIFQPQTQYRDRTRTMLDPNEGKNYELGLKGEFFDGRLNASLAYFEVHEENRPIADTAYNSQPGVDYSYIGTKTQTKGYEAEISGELSPGWQLQAGYTHKIARDDDKKKVATWEPEDQLSFYTSYKLQGRLDKLTLGGGARWQAAGWQNVNNPGTRQSEKFTQDPYWLVDVMARYQLTENLSATLNVNNLFDKAYYTNIGFYDSAYYGDPRNVMVTTRWDF
ncbi:TonB-dependent siderophore receptor [Pseudomonas proteolytica]|uniref:TonB-dependent siderophore receptor n=1 Tax=Pseudomonas proteolytica TaxID=219574 RepID=A0AAW5AK10_9PSED|nr:TonB-dependent siderophore receptor [Pseudomonas proteolytica]KAA8696168.1 TonB-dependent siderophore receptor [Pseudomonas proteolytica]MCF5061135.1 TonB-dependent siderophore receptor [Pseudomonas proteolytica]MCF5104736.1 TonB-dependent siderophore receptor [Pseudomonas proteolytica]TWR71644.1 TonB-dependent siderophore receptor [Pseudomonas proteolytica]SED71840.1 outer-membrane receptor for ferric coprogen and ferric-rhodotorulic acid [Pseudomonas proteolytica]